MRVTAASQFALGSSSRPVSRKGARSGPGIRDVQTKCLVTSVNVVRREAGGVVEIAETGGQIPFRVLLFPVPRFQLLVSINDILNYLPSFLSHARAPCRPDRSVESANLSMLSHSLSLFEQRPWEEGEDGADNRKYNRYRKH